MIARYYEYTNYKEKQKKHSARLDILVLEFRFPARREDKSPGTGLYER